jgi:hypothetical protein
MSVGHSTIRGTIRYTSRQEQRMNAERGREYFSITRQSDRTLVMHAHCEIDDEPDVVRDVVLAMDEHGAPRDCHVRLSVGGRFEGSGWMCFTDTAARCETYNAAGELIRQELPIQSPVRWLQAHPIAGDGLLMKLYDLAQGPGKTFFSDLMLTSPDHRGATGPELFVTGFGLRYVGEETVTVAAGEFAARHFQVVDTAGNLPEEHPPYDVWVTADEDYLFLKAAVGGYMQTYYELTDLVRE